MELTKSTLQKVFNHFNHLGDFEDFSELTSGHINDTFFIKTNSSQNYVLQRINSYVFKKSKELIENKIKVSEHIKEKLKHLSEEEIRRSVFQLIRTKNGLPYYLDEDENYWNASIFIEGSKVFERVENKEIAYEAGKLVGEFINLTEGLNPNEIVDIIPNFHKMSFRYEQFYEAEKNASSKRLEMAIPLIQKVKDLKEEMHILENLKKEGKIPVRITHNDTKISNILFDEKNKGICVIDTDTVMTGIIHYDFGDAIRTSCNNAFEDETDLSKVTFNTEYFNAFSKGFLQKMHSQLSPLDVQHLALSAKTITFIMGLRMLTDFLNNDVYYKTRYENHNLDRAANQFKLVDEITTHFEQMNKDIQKEYNLLKTNKNG